MHQHPHVEALTSIARLIAGDLDLDRIVQAVTDGATVVSGAKFGAFLYNPVDGSDMLCAISGAPWDAFQIFGLPRNATDFQSTFRDTAAVRSEDIRLTPRSNETGSHYGVPQAHSSVASYLAAPVMSRFGEVLGGLFLAHDEPAAFTQEAEDIVVAIAVLAGLAIDNARVHQASQRLAALVESCDDAIYSIDLNGLLTSWNAAAQRLFGYRAEEVIGRPVTILIPHDHHAEAPPILERLRREERVHHYETARLRQDGGRIEISLTVSPIKDAQGRLVGASEIARDISERKLLIGEMDHRVKNTLAMVQALAALTLKSATSEEQGAFSGRLQALAGAYDLLRQENWNRAALHDVVERALRPFPKERFDISGPTVMLDGSRCQLLTMALHELATNAAKYGALSDGAGRVDIGWTTSGSRLQLGWREHGGPPVAPPGRNGFGSFLIEHSISGGEDRAQIQYAPTGVTCTLDMGL